MWSTKCTKCWELKDENAHVNPRIFFGGSDFDDASGEGLYDNGHPCKACRNEHQRNTITPDGVLRVE